MLRNRRNDRLFLMRENAPSAWMLRFTRSRIPRGVVIRSCDSLRYCWNGLDSSILFVLSSRGLLLRLRM